MKKEYELYAIVAILVSLAVFLSFYAATMPSKYDKGYEDGYHTRNTELDELEYYAYKCTPKGMNEPINFVVLTLLPQAIEPDSFEFIEPEDNATIVCNLIGPAVGPDVIG